MQVSCEPLLEGPHNKESKTMCCASSIVSPASLALRASVSQNFHKHGQQFLFLFRLFYILAFSCPWYIFLYYALKCNIHRVNCICHESTCSQAEQIHVISTQIKDQKSTCFAELILGLLSVTVRIRATSMLTSKIIVFSSFVLDAGGLIYLRLCLVSFSQYSKQD